MSRLLRPLTYRARALRRAETPAERELWRWLRGRKLEGTKFRRQQPLGPFVVDFFSEDARLVIEADGSGHFSPPLRDHARDHWLAAAGLTVLRFEKFQILVTNAPAGSGPGVLHRASGGGSSAVGPGPGFEVEAVLHAARSVRAMKAERVMRFTSAAEPSD